MNVCNLDIDLICHTSVQINLLAFGASWSCERKENTRTNPHFRDEHCCMKKILY